MNEQLNNTKEVALCSSLPSRIIVKSNSEVSQDVDLSTGQTFSLYFCQTGHTKFLNYCYEMREVLQILHFPQAHPIITKLTSKLKFLFAASIKSVTRFRMFFLPRLFMSELWFKMASTSQSLGDRFPWFPIKIQISKVYLHTAKTMRRCHRVGENIC